ncbi:AAEL008230-PA [Aedes aegypti]|uniref:AAEL008230-PA n=1 Tax=Aedes aegypti TaxID=7159 RepID=Q16ZE0_AEDAE|nr:AAEL008230-PA [Aedes aegypti]
MAIQFDDEEAAGFCGIQCLDKNQFLSAGFHDHNNRLPAIAELYATCVNRWPLNSPED